MYGHSMKARLMTLFLALALTTAVPTAYAQETPGPESAGATESSASGEQEAPPAKPTELDLPEDASIKIRVHPLMPSNLVDRVGEPATVTVECPGAVSAEIYIVPVDAPYGGHALDRPRLIGKDVKPGDGLTVHWSDQEPDQYIKLFAVVRKRSLPDRRVRSHPLDLAMYGARYKPVLKKTTGR
jgi:hypothetical protein